MRTPDTYPPELGSHLLSVAATGVVPGKVHVRAAQIVNEIDQLLCSLIETDEKTLICGGAELGLASVIRNALILDDNLAEQNCYADEELAISDYNRILIFSDWISGAIDLHCKFRVLNSTIRPPQSFYVIELKGFKHHKAVETLSKSKMLKWYQYREWLKINSSHMHLGYTTHEQEYFTLRDLSPDY